MNYKESKKYNSIGFFISILFILLIINSKTTSTHSNNGIIVGAAGFSETLYETKEALQGLTRFINSISSSVKAITSILGFRAIVLLIFVVFFSTIFSIFGIPKGKTSFFISLITVDLLWFHWERSFNPNTFSYLSNIFKTNLVLIAPVILLLIVKKIAPIIFRRIRPLINKVPFITRKTYNKREMVSVLEKYQESSSEFQKSFTKDIINGDGGRVILSNNTNKGIKSLNEILQFLRKNQTKK